MDRHRYVTATERYGRLLIEAAGDLTLPVPSCPEWVMADLVWHVGEVMSFWRRVLSGEITSLESYVAPPRPPSAELARWYEGVLGGLVAELAAADPAQPAWTWSTQKNVGFIQRRMAHETAVHAWDALAAIGRDEPIDRELAVDGIDEFLEFLLPRTPAHGGSVHLHATDGPGEWTISPDGENWQVSREHGKGDAAVRGRASDLLLLLWRRRAPEALETFGDQDVLCGFLSTSRLG